MYGTLNFPTWKPMAGSLLTALSRPQSETESGRSTFYGCDGALLVDLGGSDRSHLVVSPYSLRGYRLNSWPSEMLNFTFSGLPNPPCEVVGGLKAKMMKSSPLHPLITFPFLPLSLQSTRPRIC